MNWPFHLGKFSEHALQLSKYAFKPWYFQDYIFENFRLIEGVGAVSCFSVFFFFSFLENCEAVVKL